MFLHLQNFSELCGMINSLLVGPDKEVSQDALKLIVNKSYEDIGLLIASVPKPTINRGSQSLTKAPVVNAAKPREAWSGAYVDDDAEYDDVIRGQSSHHHQQQNVRAPATLPSFAPPLPAKPTLMSSPQSIPMVPLSKPNLKSHPTHFVPPSLAPSVPPSRSSGPPLPAPRLHQSSGQSEVVFSGRFDRPADVAV